MGCHEMLPLTDLVNQERLFLSQIHLPQKKEPESIFAIDCCFPRVFQHLSTLQHLEPLIITNYHIFQAGKAENQCQAATALESKAVKPRKRCGNLSLRPQDQPLKGPLNISRKNYTKTSG